MSEPKRKVQQQPPPELEYSDVSQEIASPFADLLNRRDEPTLSQTDFDEIELALDR